MSIKVTYNNSTIAEFTEGKKILKCADKKMLTDVVVSYEEDVVLKTFNYTNTSTNSTKTYTYEEGMTWEEFINSEYNTDDFFYLSLSKVWCKDSSGWGISTDIYSGGPISSTDLISYETYYQNPYSTGGGN